MLRMSHWSLLPGLMTHQKIVLLACGSFNPPTLMHLRMFELARDHLHKYGLGQVVGGIISPVHDGYGKKDLAPSNQRCELLKAALKDSDWIHLSDWECKSKEWRRTLDVLNYHKKELNDNLKSSSEDSNINNNVPVWVQQVLNLSPETTEVSLKLLCGGDLLEAFANTQVWSPRDVEAIVRDFGIVVITRAGTDPAKFFYESDVLSEYRRNVTIVFEWASNDVSSTKIRRAIRRGESIKYLVSEDVINYIKKSGLYSSMTDHKYLLCDNSSICLTPSPNDAVMMIPSIDTPDSGNYSNSSLKGAKRPRPGHPMALRKVTREESIDETRVEIQISEDGHIEVISDKETTV